MKKTTLFAAVACAALLSFHTDALDLTLKNGRELPNVTIVNTAKNRVTLVTTASNGVSTLRSIRFSEFSDQSLNALKQYFMENINSYMEPARSEKRANFNALQNLQQYSAAQRQNSNALQQQVLFSAAPAIRFSLRPVFPNQVTTPPAQQPGGGTTDSQIILPTYPHNINFLSLGMITVLIVTPCKRRKQ